MTKHRPFSDAAGFTRHCWECMHATDWDGEIGRCGLTGWFVHKYDSPDNQCSHLPDGCEYEYGRKR